MKILIKFAFMSFLLMLVSGCVTDNRLPSEDIEVLEKHADLIRILKDPQISPNSREKYEAAMELIRHVDLTYTRETATVDKLFYYRDAQIDGIDTDTAIFTFTYRYGNDYIRFRFFTCRMFVTRVEIKENE
ncbi:MAG: hypothetical protein E7053_09630 [Lentisphaerae bacterium]|nr:hypothetical protein [Lentisphaerota bacterium]